MKRYLFLLGVCFLGIGLWGCGIGYVSNMQNVPMFQEKGEFRGTIGPTNFQFAYSPVQNLGVMVNGQYYTFLANEFNGDFKAELALIEGGAGVYFPPEDMYGFIYEVYGGGGVGSMKIQNNNLTSVNYSANTLRFFLQPSIGFVHDIADVAFSVRMNYLIFSSVDTLRYKESGISNYYKLPESGASYGFFEPAITLRVGYKYMKFFMQPQVTVPFGLFSAQNLTYFPFTFNVGVHVNLAPRFRK